MKLDTAAKLTEIVSGIAVIVTLVILVVEVRENTSVLQRNSFENLSNNLIEWRKVIVEDQELFNAWYREVMANEDLSGEEFKRFTVHMEILWLTYEQAFFSYRSGFLGDEEWGRFNYWVCDAYGPKRVWLEVSKSLSEPFKNYVGTCRPDWN
jgi:hypothetical protein